MHDDGPITPSALEIAVICMSVVLFITAIGATTRECKWSTDRFDGYGAAVRIVDDERFPLYLCSDEINGEMKNCVSAKHMIQFGREYWKTRGVAESYQDTNYWKTRTCPSGQTCITGPCGPEGRMIENNVCVSVVK